ncbi:hypothetical protein D1872_283220 [compost metagenome]
MQNDITLLRGTCLQVIKAFPCDKVFGTGNPALCYCTGEISAWSIRVFSFCAEQAVDPSVLMLYKTHVIYVGIRFAGLWQYNRMIPESEAVHTVVAFGYCKK